MKSKIKVFAGLGSSEASPTGLQMTISLLCPHKVSPQCLCHPYYKDTSTWIKTHLGSSRRGAVVNESD